MAWGLGLWAGARFIEGVTGRSIWDLLAELGEEAAAQKRERQRQERVRTILEGQAPLLELPAGLSERILSPSTPPAAPSSRPVPGEVRQPPAALVAPTTKPDAAWRQRIIDPSVVLILGKRGSGKSALGYRLLELFRYGPRPYVVGVPASARSLLPDWIGIAPSLEEVPRNAMALVDEAYLAYHARGSMLRESRAMSQMLNLSRQREQTLVFVSQEARQVDRNIASSANVVVFKDLGMLQLEFDRPELAKLASQAQAALDGVTGDKRRRSFVYAPDTDFCGLMENQLPSFWKPSLSKLFASEGAPAAHRPSKQPTPQEKAARAKAMRQQGASLKTIADALGVARGTVVNYLQGYPYRPR